MRWASTTRRSSSTFYKSIPIKDSKRGWRMPFIAGEDARHRARSPISPTPRPARSWSRPARRSPPARRASWPRAASRRCWSPPRTSPAATSPRTSSISATGKIYAEAGSELDEKLLAELKDQKVKEFHILDIDHVSVGPFIRNTLNLDKNANQDEALMDIYRIMRPGEPPTIEAATALFNGLFFDTERYDLSAVGRVKMNMRLGEVPASSAAEDTVRILRRDDILAVVRTLVDLRDGKGQIDDIDHLGNRRVRSVGELMENQYRVGLLRMERAIKERMSSVDIDTVMPQDLINAKPAAAAVREFFGSSQLSPVHGPDQPAVGDHAQAASLGARPGRSDPRARRLRGARRASDALRPHLPDRDAGRPQHRSDQLAGDVRPRQQVRLHREPLPQGRRTAR